MFGRTITTALERRRWSPPPGTTHVFQWMPPQLVGSGSDDPDDGLWDIQTLDNWLACRYSGDLPGMYGPDTVPWADLATFVWNEWQQSVTLRPFTVEIGGIGTAPAYWLIPA